MTELNWSTQLSEKQRFNLAKIRQPSYTMADIPTEDIPAALVSLRAAADCIYGMCCFQDEPERNLRTALRVIEHVQGDLDDARAAVRAALLKEKLDDFLTSY